MGRKSNAKKSKKNRQSTQKSAKKQIQKQSLELQETQSFEMMDRSALADVLSLETESQVIEELSPEIGENVAPKWPLIAKIAILVAIVLAAYLSILIYGSTTYADCFAPNTFVNGILVAELSAEQAKNQIEAAAEKIEIRVREGSADEYIKGADIGYDVELQVDVSTLITSQHPTQWVYNLFTPQYYSFDETSSYDREKMEQAAYHLGFVTDPIRQKPVDAYIAKSTKQYYIIDAIDGNTILTDKLIALLAEEMDAGKREVDLTGADIYDKAKIRRKDLEATDQLARMNALFGLDLVYDFISETEPINAKTITEWLNWDAKTEKYQLDKTKVEAHVQEWAKTYDTLRTDRQFKTSHGTTITIGGGIYGWRMNTAATSARLIEQIEKRKVGAFEPVYSTHGFTREADHSDIGDTYIEIDISVQTLWYYQDGKLVLETGVVTGLPTPERESTPGVYCIWSKETARYLTGDDYKLWVDYWMPINYSGMGIHDASWQWNFGGKQYLYTGSHGCINTPGAMVAELYDMVELYTPVILYKSQG